MATGHVAVPESDEQPVAQPVEPVASVDRAIEAVFARWARRTRAPGVAWGVVRSGELAASGGVGVLRVGAPEAPDADSVFRIASMTKSFTGAALMTLVVDGTLRLDDPVEIHVPELKGWGRTTSDAPALTVRHLASMEAGLPTDDAWADRHLDLPDEAMDALLEAGAAFAWTPGTHFEYSNLGWGLLGRVVERVAGVRVQELVTSALLEPLGMTATSWVRPPLGSVGEPHRVQDTEWVHEVEPVGDGTIAPMGGLWTTVRDLARWVGFFTDAFPARDGTDDGPLPRWARREMQQLRRVDQVSSVRPSPGGASRVVATGYGLGLGVRVDERLGVSVGHSGGLPGYGSHMRWLPGHGIGVIGLSNVTYGNMHAACVEALEVLGDLDALGPSHGVTATPELERSAARSAALLSAWSDTEADALFADNVGVDDGYERRAADATRVIERHGPLVVESLEPETPMRGAFTAAGATVRVELGLNHEGKVQWLDVEDRSQPSDEPIVVEESTLAAAAGTAYLILRPVGGLAEAFERWQGDTLDRLGVVRASVPAGHVTIKSFGSAAAPLSPEDEARSTEVVLAWARTQPSIELRASKLGLFEEERIPVLELEATGSFARALRAMRSQADTLPAGDSDQISVEAWIPHLSLAYPDEVDDARWAELSAWASWVSVGDVSCVSTIAELVAYDGGPERRLGAFPLGGGQGA